MTDLNMTQSPQDQTSSRETTIIKTSIIGIVANVFLAAFKAVVGLLSHSIAIVLDAVNNISDAGSSLITIIGTKLAGKAPDKKHPFGYGRVEYLSAMIISVIVLYAGITSLTESVKQIIHPETPDYSPAALIIVGVAVAVKIVLGRYVKSVGERVNSDSLVNSGADAMLDSVISASTLVAAAVYIFFGVSLEAYLAAVISLVIVKSGMDMLRDTISSILGERNDSELAANIRQTVRSFPEVKGAYDLVLNNYGPDSWNGSVHIEVEDKLSADKLDKLIRSIQVEVYRQYNVILTAIGVYSVNTVDPEVIEAREKVMKIAFSHEYVRELHGFYLEKDVKAMRFDLVISFDAPSRRKVHDDVVEDVREAFPGYTLNVTMDTDFAEE